MFAFTFWGSLPVSRKWHPPNTSWSFNPLGREWNLVPYQARYLEVARYAPLIASTQMPEGHFFMCESKKDSRVCNSRTSSSGYHYQRCHALEYVPFAERPDQIVILGKSLLSSFFLCAQILK
jgi:alpha-1,3(6)-mannosylglycoprotein beta-1,6-N-acetyl-glucosaminyltransferase